MTESFLPPWYMRSALAQILLTSSRIHTGDNNPVLENEQSVILNPVEAIRLQGFYSPQTRQPAKGLVLLLHGWEGSAHSTYVLRTGRCLYENGWSVFRLNYRDHGDTHHLNPGLFYAVLLDEVFGAVQEIAQYAPDLPFHIAGFSLGGNFALRIARRCKSQPIGNLRHVVSVSPALDPSKSTRAIDQNPFLRRYFHRKWSRSLQKKQALFPDQYDFQDIFRLGTLFEMTEEMLRRYSHYANAAEYFQEYTVVGEALAGLTVPTTIIAAQDDPIIPVDDFYTLRLPPTAKLIVHRYGGHNGFLETLSGRAWYEKTILDGWVPPT